MDMYSNLSQVMSKCTNSTDYLSKETENELAIATIKILKDCKAKRHWKGVKSSPKSKKSSKLKLNKTFNLGIKEPKIAYGNEAQEF